jgi:hypothetical protein
MEVTISTCGDTGMAHLNDGEAHAVILDSLAVFILKDGDFWIAQGLQINHFSYGKTEEEAKDRFVSSLKSTIQKHLEVYKHLEYLQIVSPSDVWQEAIKANGTQKFHHVGYYEVKIGNTKSIPFFEKISFLKSPIQAVAV